MTKSLSASERRSLILQTVDWYRESSAAINKAGGNPDVVLGKLSDEVIEIMVLNGIKLSHSQYPKKDNSELGLGLEYDYEDDMPRTRLSSYDDW